MLCIYWQFTGPRGSWRICDVDGRFAVKCAANCIPPVTNSVLRIEEMQAMLSCSKCDSSQPFFVLQELVIYPRYEKSTEDWSLAVQTMLTKLGSIVAIPVCNQDKKPEKARLPHTGPKRV